VVSCGNKCLPATPASPWQLPLPLHHPRLLHHLWHFSVLNALIYVKYDTRHNMQKKKKEIKEEKKKNILIN